MIAGTRGADGRPRSASQAIVAGEIPPRALPGMATTIGIVATDAQLSKAQCQKLASMAHNGLARSIDPVHTMADGDTLFALATGSSGRPGEMTRARRAGRHRHRARGVERGARRHRPGRPAAAFGARPRAGLSLRYLGLAS